MKYQEVLGLVVDPLDENEDYDVDRVKIQPQDIEMKVRGAAKKKSLR